jgi:hypothetical protein
MRIDVIFRTEDEDFYEVRDSSDDFQGHLFGAILEEGAVFDYAGRRWRVSSEENQPTTFICTPVPDEDGGA